MKLRETVLTGLSPGVQQHALTAFWNYLLLMEIARKILFEEAKYSYSIPGLRSAYLKIAKAYGEDLGTEQGDFSERLLALVDEIASRRQEMLQVSTTAQVTELIYRHNIQALSEALSEYMTASRKEDIWLLFDNIDKGWPIYAPQPEDILLLKSLLEATRKLQRQFEHKNVECIGVVFLRNDIYHHLVLDPADRGKETAILLDWNDPQVFKEIIRRRIITSTALDRPFDDLWPILFDSHVRGEDSFAFILGRTLMRPRELLRFVRECIGTAINRGHDKVLEADILFAEQSYSDDALVDLNMEMKDVNPEFSEVAYAFIGQPRVLSEEQVLKALKDAGVAADVSYRVIELLLWFGFLGIVVGRDEERYSYSHQHDIEKMLRGFSEFSYTIHPAFRLALGCK